MILRNSSAPLVSDIPPLVAWQPLPPRPAMQAAPETYSVVVREVNVKELLFALARDAQLNVDIHEGIEGRVTLNAVDQTLPQLLKRIARQADIRWEVDGPNLIVMPDAPHLKRYVVDYVNVARDVSSSLAVTTQVASGAPGNNGPTAAATANNTVTRIENLSRNHFWDSLVQNIKDILRETDKILPEGSSEEVEEVSGNVSTSGTGQKQAANPSTGGKSSSGSKGTGGPSSPATALAASPNPAELQNRGTRVIRRSTFREAASVIAHPETGILAVRASSRQHAKVQEFLDSVLAAARRQVLIEATVAEVRLDGDYQQGIDWGRLGNGFSLLQRSPSGSPLNQSGTPVFQIGYVNANSALGNINASLKLLESFGTVKVISSPKISVLNNQTAVLKVVDTEVYFTIKADTTVSANVGSQTTYTTSVNAVPVGFVMNVTPQISQADTVVLNVRPSVSRKIGSVLDPNPDLAKANVQSAIPVIRTREMESVLRIENGQLAIMGGLMEDSLALQRDGLPGSERLGLIGEIFNNRHNARSKTELVIFLRPTVLRDARPHPTSGHLAHIPNGPGSSSSVLALEDPQTERP